MGEHTQISWCDHTFNPWIGCTKVSGFPLALNIWNARLKALFALPSFMPKTWAA